jgi:protein-S-isoprenylcysteine O-methyltransferase Ste14
MTIQTEAAPRGAAVVFIPPPLYYGAGLGLGLLLDGLLPISIGGRPITAVAGAAAVVAGAGLTLGGLAGVIGHRTTVVPHHPVAALVTDGVYRWSRNPMYTGLGIAYLGAALLLDSWWPVALWPLVLLAVDRLVIRPEERYLSTRFGQAYAAYRARVRRWL